MSAGHGPLETVLYEAVRTKDINRARRALVAGAKTKFKYIVYLKNDRPVLASPLLITVMVGDENMARLLLDHGATANTKDGEGYTALHWASGRGDEAIVRLLLERGADPTAENKESNGVYDAMIEALIESGANPTLAHKGSGITPIDVARTPEIAKIVTEAKASFPATWGGRRKTRRAKRRAECGRTFRRTSKGRNKNGY
jgi:hypothetical protein